MANDAMAKAQGIPNDQTVDARKSSAKGVLIIGVWSFFGHWESAIGHCRTPRKPTLEIVNNFSPLSFDLLSVRVKLNANHKINPKRLMKKSIVILLATFGISTLGYGQSTIAQWTFENFASIGGQPAGVWLTNFAAEVGNGTGTAWHAGIAAYSAVAGNGSVRSLSANNWAVGDLFQFAVSTLGYSGISVAYDQTSSSTGPRRFNLAYSLDGANFTTFAADYLVLTNSTSTDNSGTGLSTLPWSSSTPRQSAYSYADNLSSVTALDNASTIYFRVVCNQAPGGSGGTDRIDNFTVLAQVPEPSTLALAALGGLLGLVAWQRKR